ncbi:MAG: methyl-accepting chemotaxis protein [Gammaproteobacteria bacterium]
MLNKIAVINSKFKIRTKILFGFGLMIAILCVVALVAIRSLMLTQNGISFVVESSQPMTFHSMILLEKVERSGQALGFFLVSKENEYKNEYQNNIDAAKAELEILKAFPYVKQNPELAERVSNIENKILKYNEHHKKLFQYAASMSENIPAMLFAAQEINPASQQMLQLLTQAILSEDEEESSDERKTLLNDFNNLRYAWANVMNGVRAFLAFQGENSLDEIRLYSESSKNLIDKIQNQGDLLTLDQEDSIMQFAALYKSIIGKFAHIVELSKGEHWRQDSYLLRKEVGPLLHQISEEISLLVAEQKSITENTSAELLANVVDTITVVIGILVSGIILALGTGWLISNMITTPLNNAVQAMREIAEGDGDLTSRLPSNGSDEVSALAKAFNHFVAKVQETISEVSGSTAQLASAAEEMSLITNETRDGTIKQQNETDLVATAMTEMTSTVQEVSNNANAAADAAQQADTKASEGNSIVSKTIDLIDALAGEIEQASQVINRVEKDSDSIGSVLSVIQGIAEQTNLLALNAAIEAARAGEQGRGFAVVADEVRTLASRTQESTQEIQTMIESLQSGTRSAVEVMELSREKAKTTVNQASEAGSALHSITAAVGEINQMNNQIAEASQQQGQVAEEINVNIVNITDIATQTADGTDQLAAASGELATLSNNLQMLVARFKV